MVKLREAWCDINIAALKRNAQRAKTLFGPDVTLMSVLKADAYGHGAVAMMRHLIEAGIEWFAVASLNEALELRLRFPQANILIFGYISDECLPVAIKHDFMLTVYLERQAELIETIAASLGKRCRIFIKVETGLGRIGFSPVPDNADLIARLDKSAHLEVLSVYTATTGTNDRLEHRQVDVFFTFVDLLKERGVVPRFIHYANGNTVGRCPWMLDDKRYNMVRPGCMFFGNAFFDGFEEILSFKARVVRVAEIPAGQGVGYMQSYDPPNHVRKIATLPFGHADGIPCAVALQGGHVLINGQKAPYEGKLCMDMCTVDVTSIPHVEVGTIVDVLGRQEHEMTWAEAAAMAQIKGNAVKASLARRLPRVYHHDGVVSYIVDEVLGDRCF